MTTRVLTRGRFSGSGHIHEVTIDTESGLIERIGDDRIGSVDVQSTYSPLFFPGFIDVHNHGAVGHDVNDSTAEELLEVAAFLAKNGVTAWVPTLVPDSDENYERIIGEIDRLMELQCGKPVAQAVGVHYEGVFANEAMCGALRAQYFKTYKTENHPFAESATPLLREEGSLVGLPRLRRGVHMTTLAPEVVGGIELIKQLVADGWIVSIGHTQANAKTLDFALDAGAWHMTHFFNAMTGIHHRELGVAGWGLSRKEITFDIIADGIHVAPKMLKLACEAKGIDRVSLISDSVAPTGLGDGEFELWGERITVSGGRTQNERGSIAGSVITLHDAVKRMLALGFSVADVSKMASANPAKLLGLENQIGSLSEGKRADLVALDEDGSISFTMIGGLLVN
jgi:N-acetylglucosamine-6-phosphate deacetylase